MEQNRQKLLLQSILVGAIIVGIIIAAIIIIPQTRKPDRRRVTYRVESSSGSVTILYKAGGEQQTDPERTFNTPWEREFVLDSGTEVYLFAGNYQQMGDLKCVLRLDGQVWKTDLAKMPVDRVACAGIVR